MTKLREVVIVSACRTAIGAFGGSFKDVATPKLCEAVMKEAIKRAKIDKSAIGVVMQSVWVLISPPLR